MDTDALSKKFEQAMFNIYRTAAKECRYRPTYFLQMLTDQGGVSTAQKLVRAEKTSEGFAKLWELGRLDLTVEALVLDPRWSDLFSEDDLAKARKRLANHGYQAR